MPLYAAGQRIRGSEINALPQMYRSTADVICNNSTVMRAVTGLAFAGEVGGSYFVEALIAYLSSEAADLKLNWTVPAGTTGWWSGGQGVSLTGNRIGTYDAGCFVNDFSAVCGVGGDNSFACACKPIGVFTIGATAGTVQLQFAQWAAAAFDSRIYAGSCLRVSRMV